MKSRQEHPPHGWVFTDPRIPQWQAPAGSFDTVVRAVITLRQGNPALTAQHNLATDYNTVSNEVDEQNAARCIAHGWSNLVMDQGTGPPNPSFLPPQRLANRVVAVTASVKRAMVGVAVIRDWWLGDSLKPVETPLAEKRAHVCVLCPLNTEPRFFDKLAAHVAETFKGLVQAKADMDLKTSVDDKLFSCSACSCWNPLKVWTPLAHIKKTLKSEDAAKLHETCWIRHES